MEKFSRVKALVDLDAVAYNFEAMHKNIKPGTKMIAVVKDVYKRQIHAFMGRVKTEEARKGIQLADELSDMILFHTRVCENGKKMEHLWEETR